MLYVYVESDDTLHMVCLGTVELDENPFLVASYPDELAANACAQELANKLREGGASVQLH